MIRRHLACGPPDWDWRSWSYLLLVSEIGWAWKLANHVCLRLDTYCWLDPFSFFEECGVRRLDCKSSWRPWTQGMISVRVIHFILHLSNQLLSVPLLSGRGTKRRPEGRTGVRGLEWLFPREGLRRNRSTPCLRQDGWGWSVAQVSSSAWLSCSFLG